MDDDHKRAYRSLIAYAMVDIRNSVYTKHRWYHHVLRGRLIDEQRRIQRGFAIADWMHNVAIYSSRDFKGFDEAWFWEEYQRYSERYALSGYRWVFDRALEGPFLTA